MNFSGGNFFDLPKDLPLNFELFEPFISGEDLTVERIISTGQQTPENQWLEEDQDEWVLLIQGEAQLKFEDGIKKKLLPGDYLHIPKNSKHKVESTSTDPPCIWLAIHYK